MLQQLLASIVKELRLLARDVHGLGLLFILPLAFILVMSFALQDLFAARQGQGLGVVVIDHEDTDASRRLYERLASNEAFALKHGEAAAASYLDRGDNSFTLEIREGFAQSLVGAPQTNAPPKLIVTVAPDTDKRTELIFVAAVRQAIGRQRVERLLSQMGMGGQTSGGAMTSLDSSVGVEYAYPDSGGQAPSAVQQNVPAWLVFSIFFIGIPFSNTFIRERQIGTQRRLRTINLNPATQFLGKLAPYFVVNQAQVALMLAAGVFLVPLLGGQALAIHGSPLALVLLSASLSVAALGLALLIAVISRTTEQATLLSGLGSIVFAAIGGVMVPKFVMPAAMQTVADYSPMSWGLEAFLTLLLHNGGVADISGELAKLCGFGLCATAVAWLFYRRQE
ncbi:MAG: ABC transporter permease [Caulobacterales bacterium]